MIERFLVSEVKRSSADSRPPAEAEAEAQLARILGSPAFAASARRKALLRYLVEETLAGRAERLKGFAIAAAVFGRDETFDAQTDPVVRLEARRLRRDLDGYYATAGARDALRLAIPKGAYAVTFEVLDGDPPPPPPPTPSAVPAAATGARRRARSFLGLLAPAIALLILAVGAWLWTTGREADRAGAGSEPSARGPSVIVLPFEALSANEDDRYLASGMTIELIGDLMRYDGFRLYSVPASFRQDAAADPAALGRDLPVAYVVRGQLRSADDVVRVAVQLVNAQTDEVLWSKTFDRALTTANLLDLQDELAGRIASLLGQSYGVLNSDAASRKLAPSMATYACILRAYEYRRTFAVDLHGPVVACLEASVRRDPDYADAWALLGWLRLDAARFDLVPKAAAGGELASAREAVARAVALDPTDVRALQAFAAVAFYAGDYAGSERVQRQALALDPHDPETLVQLGWRLAVRGDFDEGLGYIREAIDRSVDPPGWYYQLISIHDFMAGHYAQALEAAEHSGRNGSEVGLSLMAMSQAALGDRAAAARTLATLEAQAPDFYADPEAVYRSHQPTDEIVEALMAGLRQAGWQPPKVAGG